MARQHPGSDCPWCAGEDECAVGRPPPRPRRAHDRSCPVRAPGWRVPPRLPKVTWAESARVAVVLPPVGAPREQWPELARGMRAAGATYAAIGERFGVTTTTAWRWLNPRP
jgi:hypothetical protein